MAETILVTTRLLPNGVRFTYQPAWDSSIYRSALEHRLHQLKTYAAMGQTDEIIRKPGFLEFVDEDPPRYPQSPRGIPIQVTPQMLENIKAANKAAKAEHRYNDCVAVVECDGSQWVLSPFANCWRIQVNVLFRLAVARQLHCEYRVDKGMASWVGQMPIRLET